MIIVEKPSWLRNLFSLRGTALRRIWRRVLFTTAMAVVVTVVDLSLDQMFHKDLTPLPFSLIGVALGIFLGFRNNTAYDRFWEGRKLWGRMVNTSRTLTRQVLTLVGPMPIGEGEAPEGGDAEALRLFHSETVHRLAAYVHMCRMNLRDDDDLDSLKRLIPDEEADALRFESNRPNAILQTLGDSFRQAWMRGWVHAQHLPVLEDSLTQMTDIQGGCERIKSTPIPFSYTALIHRIVAIYCYTLPFGLVNEIQELTPVVVAIISYAFFGLDAVGDEIEDPFGTDANDLPLSTISTMIEVNIRQRLGEVDLPEIPKPIDEILS